MARIAIEDGAPGPAAADAPPFDGSGRFELVACIGRGGMGVVYEALDKEQNIRLAIKSLPRIVGADAILRFKNEFRALQDIQHRNLVGLGELFEERGRWFFTMELVRGVDFVTWVRGGKPLVRDSETLTSAPSGQRATLRLPPPILKPPIGDGVPFDESRLRPALAQLAAGLAALHRAGKVHRDVKPSNILVTPSGEVRILDFGLISDSDRDFVWAAEDVVGTPSFMAPEQAAGTHAGPEADWYAMGVILYAALAGRLPFVGEGGAVMYQKQTIDPPPPGELVPGVPLDLERLCVELLQRDPAARPTRRSIRDRLKTDATLSAGPDEHVVFVGRAPELYACFDAFAAAKTESTVLLVQGESGVGKSALVAEFAGKLRVADPRALVLQGRCYERESVPFKAIDGIIDALSGRMLTMPREEVEALLPPDTALLAQVFPVLRRVPEVDEVPPGSTAMVGPEVLRARLFATCRELLQRLVKHRRVVLLVDDLQWADADSLSLIRELLRAPDAPPVLFVATLRSGSQILATEKNAVEVSLPGNVRHLALLGLPVEQARELAHELLRGAGRLDEAGAHEIASEARGHPMYIDELVRHAAARTEGGAGMRLEDALSARLRLLDGRARRLLETIVVAGGPLAIETAAHAAALDGEDLGPRLSELRGGHLVRTGGARLTDIVEPYHDRVRATVMMEIDDRAKKELHGRLALAFEQVHNHGGPGAEPEHLARHWRGAGQAERGARYAVLAADKAAGVFAFNRAAQLYRMAIEMTPGGDDALGAKLGEVLTFAGRGAEAADAYLAAANAPGALARTSRELRRLAAQQLMTAGLFDRGQLEMRRVLAAVGMDLPTNSTLALASMLVRRAQVRLRGMAFQPRAERDVSPADLERIDVCWAAVVGLGLIDIIGNADFQSRHYLLALDAGEPKRVCRALGAEAALSAASGINAAPRTKKLVAAMTEVIERVGNPPALVAFAAAAEGAAAHLEGRFAAVPALVDRVEALIGQEWTESTHFEHDSIRVIRMGSITWLGNYREYHETSGRLLEEALERRHLYMATYVRTGVHAQILLSRGQIDGARRRAEEAIRGWSTERTNVPHLLDIVARVAIGIFTEDFEGAHTCVTQGWTKVEKAFLLHCEYLRINMTETRARAALAIAHARPKDRARHLREAEKYARHLEGEAVQWAHALGALVRAGIAATRGDREATARHLSTSITKFDEQSMALHAAVARRRLGMLLGGDEGRARVAAADAKMSSEAITEIERFTRLIAPGFD